MRQRPVSIHALDLTGYEPPLARDIALAAGSRAHLTALTRTRVAGFSLANAVSGEDLEGPGLIEGPEALEGPRTLERSWPLLPIDAGVFRALGLPVMEAGEDAARDLIQGKPIDPLIEAEALRLCAGDGRVEAPGMPGEAPWSAGVFDPPGNLIAVIEQKGPDRRWTYGYVYGRA
jgi:tRNA pseudouridine55 synthase